MHIMVTRLLKVYCPSFSVVADFMFDWLTDGNKSKIESFD